VGCSTNLDVVVKRNSQPMLAQEPLIIQPIAQCYATELYQLLNDAAEVSN